MSKAPTTAQTPTRTDLFLYVSRRVEADALPAPEQLAIYSDRENVHMAFDDLADAEVWATHLRAVPTSAAVPFGDGTRLVHSWFRLEYLGWFWHVTASVDAAVAS